MAFGRKKNERPKNILGLALFRYDRIFNVELKNIIKALGSGKQLNLKRSVPIITKAVSLLDVISEDISKDNFKTDYRSDKTRYIILALIGDLKKLLQKISESPGLPEVNILDSDSKDMLARLGESRISLKNKMKEIESDYI